MHADPVTAAEAKAAFDIFDAEKSGTIRPDKYKAVLTFATQAGAELTAAEADTVLGHLEVNQDGVLDISRAVERLEALRVARVPASPGGTGFVGMKLNLQNVPHNEVDGEKPLAVPPTPTGLIVEQLQRAAEIDDARGSFNRFVSYAEWAPEPRFVSYATTDCSA
jgi:hypothetical protein